MGSDKLHQKHKAAEQKYKRKTATREPLKTYLIVCEGQTEQHYFQELCGYATNVTVTLEGGTCPLGIVRYAYDQRTDYDVILCVFDHDGKYDKFQQAQQKLRQYAAKSQAPQWIEASSVWCFEQWFLLHFTASTQVFTDQDATIAALKQQPGFNSYRKGCPKNYKRLQSRQQDALRNAAQIEQFAEANGSDNPRTTVHQAVAYLLREFPHYIDTP